MKIGIILSNTPEYSETFFLSKIRGLQGRGHQVIFLRKQETTILRNAK